jgi:hypothetical protein
MLVDDELSALNALRRAFARQDWEVLTHTSPSIALRWIRANEIGLVMAESDARYQWRRAAGGD